MKTHHKIFSILLVAFALFTAISFAQDNTEVTYAENYTLAVIDSNVYANVDTVWSEWFSAEPNLGYSWYTNPPTITYQWTSTIDEPKLFVFVEGSNDQSTEKSYKVRIDTISATIDSLETLRKGTFNFNNWKYRYYRIGFQPINIGGGNETDTDVHVEVLFIKPD